jgi:hypothetical protein
MGVGHFARGGSYDEEREQKTVWERVGDNEQRAERRGENDVSCMGSEIEFRMRGKK